MFQRLRATGSSLSIALLSLTLVDEIVSGFPTVGLPLIRDQFHLSYAQIGLLFSVSACIGTLLLKPVINLLSDRGSRRTWIMSGLLLLAAGSLLAGSTALFFILLLAFTLTDAGGQAALGGAQSTLIDQSPQKAVRTMARWTMAGALGDILAPLTVTLIVSLRLGWPALCWIAAIFWLFLAILIWPQQFPTQQQTADDEAKVPLLTSIRATLRDRVFLSWAVLSLIPTMMDEIFIGFATLYLRDAQHANGIAIGLLMADFTLAALLSLFVIERWLLHRIAPVRLLTWLALIVLAGMILFLSARSLWLVALALFIVGAGVTGWYPIAKGQAYARFPGRAGMVRAIISLGGPFEIALPGIIGLISTTFGIWAGVGSLSVAPLLVLLFLPGTREGCIDEQAKSR
jgi:predicted MFS family arabinose efflux permease